VYRTKLLKQSILLSLAVSVVLSLSINICRVAAPFPHPTIHSCDSMEVEKDIFGPSEIVYAFGDNYDPDECVTIYVTQNGGPYVSTHSLYSKTAKADSSGHLGPIDLGTFPTGEYDIWVDRGMQNGWIAYPNEPVDTFGDCAEGFLVIPEYLLGTILGLVGCFAAFGVFRVSKHHHK
jgi:hypothetical protein